MTPSNYSTTILVDQTPKEVFDAVNNVRGWWSENIEGGTDKLNAEYLYHYKDIHLCKMKITELIPDKKIVWKVLKNEFSFTQDKNEWVGNDIVFEISKLKNKTQLTFTQIGLTPAHECYNVCYDAWTGFITNSLKKLITTGKGLPTPKDTEWEFNESLISKWNIKSNKHFTKSFTTEKTPETVYNLLLNIKKWWSGLYSETIKGKSKKVNDEFTFSAGGGAHYSKQKLVELAPNKKIAWLVTESNLNFLDNTSEWVNTKICFDISKEGNKTRVIFTHKGLIPKIESYEGCASAWTQYLANLEKTLN